jgi:predicted RNase H-like nuclease (RuvC/YqgF family)
MKSQLVERTGSLKLIESKTPRKGCLGRLEGICADFKNPTRNGRLYGLQLWKNVFDNKFVKESLSTKTLFGELDHPEDRFEVLAKYACVCMTDYKIDEANGVVYGGFDILDTEAGRILKSLVDYGSQMGVSSRGEGDIIQGEDGEEVDPNTYDFACFDVVSTPAVEKARQTVVESVEQSRKKRHLLETIEREIKNADTVEVLDNIERTVTNAHCPNLGRIKRSIDNRKSQISEGKTITSKATEGITTRSNSKPSIKTIDESVKVSTTTISELNQKIRAYKLRERCLTKSIEQYKAQITELKNEHNAQNDKSLKESTKRLEVVNETAKRKINEYKETINGLNETINKLKQDKKSEVVLNNTLNKLKEDIKALKDENSNLNYQLTESERIINNYKERQTQLKEQLQEQKSINEAKESANKAQNTKIKDQINNIKTLQESMQNQSEMIDAQQNDFDVLKESYTSLETKYNELLHKYDKLNETIDKLSKDKDILSEKLNRSLSLNKSYTDTYLAEYAKYKGINPKSIALNESISSPTKIKKLIDEARERQDRFNRLPISDDKPTTVNILKEDINRGDKDDVHLESFLNAVCGTL